MAMNSQLLAVVQHIESERGVSREIVRSGDVSIIAAGGLEFRAVCRAFLCGLLQIGQGYPELIKISQNF